MRKSLAALTITAALLLHPSAAEAHRGRAAVLTPQSSSGRCDRGELSGVGEVSRCWGPLIRQCPIWDASRMERIVWRESRGYPKAYNRIPVGRKRLHAMGLFQQLGQHSTDPAKQLQDACNLARSAAKGRHGHWSNPWRATR